jgi:hypothetical protein
LVYVGRSAIAGTPKPGYLALVLEAAHDWALPADYVADLARWSPGGLRVARTPETGEIA